jgi:hypothetical protein
MFAENPQKKQNNEQSATFRTAKTGRLLKDGEEKKKNATWEEITGPDLWATKK